MSFSSIPSALTNQLNTTIAFPEEDQEFRNALTLLLRRFANTINSKEGAVYNIIEQINNGLYFDPTNTQNFRPVFRTTVNFGALPNAGAKSVAHNIGFNSSFSCTRIYGAASDTTGLTYIPIPYASASGIDDIQLDITSTNVVITTASNRTNYNLCYVVIEYLKN